MEELFPFETLKRTMSDFGKNKNPKRNLTYMLIYVVDWS